MPRVESIAALDFETTGPDPLEDRPVSCSLLILHHVAGEDKVETWIETLVKPDRPIPAEATAVHGVTEAEVWSAGVPRETVVNDVCLSLALLRIRRIPLAIYNAPFDWTLLHAEAARFGLTVPSIPIIDPLVIDRWADRYRKGSRRLENVAKLHGVTLANAHEARYDALTAGTLARDLVNEYLYLRQLETFAELHRWHQRYWREWRDNFVAYRRKKGQDTAQLEAADWPLHPTLHPTRKEPAACSS